jgi:hypothetical protein
MSIKYNDELSNKMNTDAKIQLDKDIEYINFLTEQTKKINLEELNIHFNNFEKGKRVVIRDNYDDYDATPFSIDEYADKFTEILCNLKELSHVEIYIFNLINIFGKQIGNSFFIPGHTISQGKAQYGILLYKIFCNLEKNNIFIFKEIFMAYLNCNTRVTLPYFPDYKEDKFFGNFSNYNTLDEFLTHFKREFVLYAQFVSLDRKNIDSSKDKWKYYNYTNDFSLNGFYWLIKFTYLYINSKFNEPLEYIGYLYAFIKNTYQTLILDYGNNYIKLIKYIIAKYNENLSKKSYYAWFNEEKNIYEDHMKHLQMHYIDREKFIAAIKYTSDYGYTDVHDHYYNGIHNDHMI